MGGGDPRQGRQHLRVVGAQGGLAVGEGALQQRQGPGGLVEAQVVGAEVPDRRCGQVVIGAESAVRDLHRSQQDGRRIAGPAEVVGGGAQVEQHGHQGSVGVAELGLSNRQRFEEHRLCFGVGICAAAWWVSRRRGYRGKARRGTLREILAALRDASWALLAPVIILGGIYSGVFTPTEAAVVAVFYSLFVATVVYRSIRFRELVHILVDASVTSSVIMFIVVFAGIFSWAVSTMGVADRVAELVTRLAPNAVSMVLAVNLLLLVMGMFLDAISISYLVMPILIPVLQGFGVDPLWYGVVFISALAIGQITPPVGVNLFTAANLIEDDIDVVARQLVPYVLVNVVVLVVLSLFPCLALYLPVKVGLYHP